MLNKLLQVAEGLPGIVGIRIGTEEPFYLSEARVGPVEIRRYGPRIAAQTSVDGEGQDARSTGFRRLADYIFGGNNRSTSISMTAPVAQSSAAIRFFMPSKWSLDTLPEPSSGLVTLVEVPGETMAVLRFSGDRSERAVAVKTAQLLDLLRDSDFAPSGDPVAWFYDPPWTLPPLRRNEVAVPVTASAGPPE
ncbi:heme-binding protein [Mycobacterium sp. MS1601]|uniref:SOUL family heme-binding protein n=1 Tax=Mycobacterium sp. MS1601 TaxID=1936029 RepID=UPI00097971F0|nr:heme-binding protein [Mycobacterium sp. MS1601]AQA04778.1 heme-binding protein [Mycobacterium sp. MS1601]